VNACRFADKHKRHADTREESSITTSNKIGDDVPARFSSQMSDWSDIKGSDNDSTMSSSCADDDVEDNGSFAGFALDDFQCESQAQFSLVYDEHSC